MAELTARTPRRSRGWIAAGLWLVFLIVYNANGREMPAADSQAARFAAVMLARHQTLTLDGIVGRQQLYADRPAFAKDLSGHWRNAYPLPPVLEAAAVAKVLQSVGALHLDSPAAPAVVAKLTASLLASLAGLFAFLAARRFCGTAAAALVATAFALGTGMWPVASQTLWQHATAVCSAMAAIWLWSSADRPGIGRLLAIGLLLGWSGAARPQTAPMVAILAAGVLYPVSASRRAAGLIGLIVPIAVFVGLNLYWFGDPQGGFPGVVRLNQSVHAVTSIWQWPWVGMAGLLLSPSRGLLIFSPIVLAVLAAPGARADPAHRSLLRWTAAAATAQFLIYSSFSVWWGGFTYGPRYCLDILPALVPAAAIGASRLAGASRTVRGVAVAALAWSILTAATGAFYFPHDNWNADPESVDRAHHRLWDVRDSQILRCWSRGPSPQNFALFDWANWRRAG
jgi:hypothetical protein